MDKQQLLELVPHYIAMLILVFGGLAIIDATVGEIGFWAELVIVFAIVLAYRPLVVRLGVAPSAWEPEDETIDTPE
jgi:hypothetical protein